MKYRFRKKFILFIWVTGSFNEENFVGRTCIVDGCESITIATQSGTPMIIPFDEAKKLKKLLILKPPITTTIQERINIPTDERLILDVLKLVNGTN